MLQFIYNVIKDLQYVIYLLNCIFKSQESVDAEDNLFI